jgi:DNA repair exonuclease SbcCD ATPase subunit
MNSKEALERLYSDIINLNEIEEDLKNIRDDYLIVKQDLERLEKLEKENQVLREKVNHFKNVKNRYRRNEKFVEKENTKLKKAIEILKEPVDSIEFITCDEEDCYGELCFYQKINGSISIPLKTKEEYILVKEILEND